MDDKTLFRDGKAILKLRRNPDGSSLLYKPFAVQHEHIMRITGAPGWDKEFVDQVFGENVEGGLRYHAGDLQFDIAIDKFREFAFERDIVGYGEQYHVHIKHYDTTGIKKVSPIRAEVEIPKKLVFGEVVPCSNCRGAKCAKCGGLGFLKWQS